MEHDGTPCNLTETPWTHLEYSWDPLKPQKYPLEPHRAHLRRLLNLLKPHKTPIKRYETPWNTPVTPWSSLKHPRNVFGTALPSKTHWNSMEHPLKPHAATSSVSGVPLEPRMPVGLPETSWKLMVHFRMIEIKNRSVRQEILVFVQFLCDQP